MSNAATETLQPTTAAPGSADRLGVTLLFSLILHGVLALGVSFDFAPPRPSVPTLDVTLLSTSNGETPDKADFLAQSNNRGGGDADKALRPSQPFNSPLPKPDPGIAPRPLDPAAPRPSPVSGPEVLTQLSADTSITSHPDQREQRQRASREAPVVIDRKLEMARLANEIARQKEAYAKRPHRKYISANTREYAYAAYMRTWVARTERIGNLNYPDEVRRRGLHGDLVLTVGLRRDGSVKSVDVIQSSGHKLLDDAAVRIVHLAAPYAAIPKTTEKVDELYITRTWQFLPGDILRNR